MHIDRLNSLKERLMMSVSALYKLKRDLRAIKESKCFRCKGACLIVSLLLLVSLPSVAFTAPLDLDAKNNALGSATAFGHARVVRSLGELPAGSTSMPLHLVFNSNPADAPGAFGPYWRIPLFASTVVQFNQYKLYWDGPDERRQFFVLDQSYDVRRGEKVFIERGKDWKATVDRSGDILIEALNAEGWVFQYDDGLLETFQLGAGADECRITYSGRGLPLYITNQETNRRIFEIEYAGGTDPKRIIIGDRHILVEMGDGELTAPDGVTNYRNYRVRFLRSLSHGEDQTETFTYSKADKQQRQVTTIADEPKDRITKTLNLAVNRMSISSGVDVGSDNWIEWEAKSGFVTADSGSSYAVNNDSWDPNIQDQPAPVTPDSVKITRLPIGGTEQRWSYAWNSGVRTYTDLATGEVIRRTVIMSEGPANGKLRKREVFKDGAWELDRKNSYGPSGEILRSIVLDDVYIYERDEMNQLISIYLNGNLQTSYDYVNGNKIVRKYINGSIREYTVNKGNITKLVIDGEVVSNVVDKIK